MIPGVWRRAPATGSTGTKLAASALNLPSIIAGLGASWGSAACTCKRSWNTNSYVGTDHRRGVLCPLLIFLCTLNVPGKCNLRARPPRRTQHEEVVSALHGATGAE